MSIVKPYILSLLFDMGIAQNSLSHVLRFTFYFFLIMIFTVFLSISYEYIVSTFANKFIYKIRMLVIDHFINLPTNFFDKHSTGDIITRINDDVEDIRNYLLFDLTGFYRAILSFIGATLFIGIMQWRILLVNLTILPVLAFVLHYFRKILYKVSMEVKNSYSASNQELVEGFKNINELKATNFELYFLRRQSNKFLHLLKKSVKSSVVNRTSSAMIQLVINFTYLITMGYGGYLIIEGYMTTGMLLAFLTMRSNLVSPVQAWSNLYTRYFVVKASIERLNNYYSQEIEKGLEIESNGQMTQVSDFQPIRFRKVSFNYTNNNNDFILNEISSEFKAGNWIGIKGASGIGKTTLLKLTLKLIQPTKGEILFGEQSILSVNNREWRELIGYVSQKPFALNESIKENIIMGRNCVDDKSLWDILEICCLDEDIKKLPEKLDTNISENGAIFSVGMLKRLMLARAILKPKKILLLDEFFSSLDTKLSKKIRKKLKDYLPSNTIVIIISHRDSDFEFCDKVLRLNKTLIKSGNKNELVSISQTT